MSMRVSKAMASASSSAASAQTANAASPISMLSASEFDGEMNMQSSGVSADSDQSQDREEEQNLESSSAQVSVQVGCALTSVVDAITQDLMTELPTLGFGNVKNEDDVAVTEMLDAKTVFDRQSDLLKESVETEVSLNANGETNEAANEAAYDIAKDVDLALNNDFDLSKRVSMRDRKEQNSIYDLGSLSKEDVARRSDDFVARNFSSLEKHEQNNFAVDENDTRSASSYSNLLSNEETSDLLRSQLEPIDVERAVDLTTEFDFVSRFSENDNEKGVEQILSPSLQKNSDGKFDIKEMRVQHVQAADKADVLANDTKEWLGRLGNEIKLSLGSKEHVATMRLQPAELGEMKVTVRVEGQQVQLHLVVSNDSARQAVEKNLHNLNNILAGDGLLLGFSQVDVGGKQFERQDTEEQQEALALRKNVSSKVKIASVGSILNVEQSERAFNVRI